MGLRMSLVETLQPAEPVAEELLVAVFLVAKYMQAAGIHAGG